MEFESKNTHLDPVHTGPDPYGHHINLTSFKASMTLKFVIILQNLIKTYHRKSGKSKCDRKVTELNVEITRIRSRVNGVLGLTNIHTYVQPVNLHLASLFLDVCLGVGECYPPPPPILLIPSPNKRNLSCYCLVFFH